MEVEGMNRGFADHRDSHFSTRTQIHYPLELQKTESPSQYCRDGPLNFVD